MDDIDWHVKLSISNVVDKNYTVYTVYEINTPKIGEQILNVSRNELTGKKNPGNCTDLLIIRLI